MGDRERHARFISRLTLYRQSLWSKVVDKLIGLADAAALVPDGVTISFGGFTTQRHPVACVYN